MKQRALALATAFFLASCAAGPLTPVAQRSVTIRGAVKDLTKARSLKAIRVPYELARLDHIDVKIKLEGASDYSDAGRLDPINGDFPEVVVRNLRPQSVYIVKSEAWQYDPETQQNVQVDDDTDPDGSDGDPLGASETRISTDLGDGTSQDDIVTTGGGLEVDETKAEGLEYLLPTVITPATTPALTVGVDGQISFQLKSVPQATRELGSGNRLPDGLKFRDNEDNTLSVCGTAMPWTAGQHDLLFQATNIAGTSNLNAPFNIEGPAGITYLRTLFFSGTTPITHRLTTGYPTKGVVSVPDPLPAGLTFDAAAGTLSGVPVECCSWNQAIDHWATDTVTFDLYAPSPIGSVYLSQDGNLQGSVGGSFELHYPIK